MIKKLVLKNFKKFNNHSIDLNPCDLTLMVGGNNSGKSTILQALAIWEFCKTVLKMEKGYDALINFNNYQGVGLSIEEFLPVAIPSLKHLWTNLKTQNIDADKNGYPLRIGCIWDCDSQKDCMLEFGLSLSNDRLFIKATATSPNLSQITAEQIPTIAYLPTMAGILERENRVSPAERRRMIGKGIAGAVVRNMVLDLFERNVAIRAEKKGDKDKIPNRDLLEIRQTDGFELLQQSLRNVFRSELVVHPFNNEYHTFIKVEVIKGDLVKPYILKKYSQFNNRDIMAEGSGVLQWLSVFCLILSQDIDVILLDEPDAHLHCTLQRELYNYMVDFTQKNRKQVLMATHSVEIIKHSDFYRILNVDKRSYLQNEEGKTNAIAGIGADYAPMFSLAQKHKKLVFVENRSDENILKLLADAFGTPINSNIVFWPTLESHPNRRVLFNELKSQISELKAISIRDRDTDHISNVDNGLNDKGIKPQADIKFKTWLRRNIESYLLSPSGIARAAAIDTNSVIKYFNEKYQLSIDDVSFISATNESSLCEIDGKKIYQESMNSIKNTYDISKFDVAKKLIKSEICPDITLIINEINSL